MSVLLWPPAAARAWTVVSSVLNDVAAVRAKRAELFQNADWRKFSRFTSFFRGWVPPEVQFKVPIQLQATCLPCRDDGSGEVEPIVLKTTDTWVVHAVLGPGETRNLAMSKVLEPRSLTPVVCIAALTDRNGGRPPEVTGQLFAGGINTRFASGLPVHVSAMFAVAPSTRTPYLPGGFVESAETAALSEWNKVCVCVCVCVCGVELFVVLPSS